MMLMPLRRFGFAMAGLLLLSTAGLSDTVRLKDGRVIEGTVIPQSGGYWVKGTDGNTYKLSASEVASISKGAAGGTTAAPAVPSTPGAAATAPGGAAAAGAKPKPPVNFNVTKAKCGTVDNALAAVALWQQFLDNAPANHPDLPAAKQEFTKWKGLADSSAEKIGGKWIGGAERQAILDKAIALQKEADDLIRQNQTLAALKKLEEAAAVYPNSFESNFSLAYIYMLQRQDKKAVDWLGKAAAIRPEAPEVLGNQGIMFCVKNQYEKGIPLLLKALQKGDRQELVQNLIVALTAAPPAMRNRANIKEAESAARLLATKYKIDPASRMYVIVPLYKDAGRSEKHESMWSGTGFVVSTDGLILTNRHVVDGAKTLMVTLQAAGPDGTNVTKSGDVVVIDDQQDLALVRIRVDGGKALQVVQLSPNDSPADGAECTVLGYPLLDRLGGSVKVTRGIVTSSRKEREFDVMVDAKVNPGNSGGPIFDRFGNVMAIVSMKTIGNGLEDTYGMGISAGMIRRFLAKNSIKLVAGKTDGPSLSAEEVAAKAKPCTVCILATK